MAGFTVPSSVNYSSPLNAVPLDWTEDPPEGAKGIQCSIAWGTDGGPNNAVYLNCQNNATLNFSKVRSLIVDNSMSGADVEFVFPDTETTVSIPAYTPYAIIPVFTNQVQFYVISPNAQSEDVTNFTILNTAAPPVAVPTTQEQNFNYVAGIDISGGSGSTQLIPAGINGTLEGLFASGTIGTVSTGVNATVTIEDGNGKVLAVGYMAVTGGAGGSGVINNVTLFSNSDMRVRFNNGVKIFWTLSGTPSPANVSANAYYRTP